MIQHAVAAALIAAAAPIDHTREAAYDAFVEALESPQAALLFEGGWHPEVGLGGCVPAFGVNYMCVADTSIPGEGGSRMFMAIVKPTDDGFELGQVWVYDRVEGLSLEPGIQIDGAPVEPSLPAPECESVGDYVAPVDGSVEGIIERARDLAQDDGGPMDDEGVCAFVALCTMDPANPMTGSLLSAAVKDEPVIGHLPV